MWKALFFKEWIKTRLMLAGVLLVTVGFAAYAMLRLYRVAELQGMAHVWEVMLMRDVLFVDVMTYVPLLLGALLAVTQFVPEVYRKCLKLTLHLPVPHLQLINTMLAYGVLALLLCFAAGYLVLWRAMAPVLAPELMHRVLLTALPWHLAGIAAYLLVAWLLLEPTWKLRLFGALLAAALLHLYFLAPAPEACNAFLPALTLWTLLLALLVWHAVARFREGRQD